MCPQFDAPLEHVVAVSARLLAICAETTQTTFMITHDIHEAFKLGTRLLVFDKVRKYSAQNGSPHMTAVLAIGYESFPEDIGIKRDYADALNGIQVANLSLGSSGHPGSIAEAAFVRTARKLFDGAVFPRG